MTQETLRGYNTRAAVALTAAHVRLVSTRSRGRFNMGSVFCRSIVAFTLCAPLWTAGLSSQTIDVATTFSALRTLPNGCAPVASFGVVGAEATADWPLARLAWTGALAPVSENTVHSSVVRASVVSPEWRGWRVDAHAVRELRGNACAGQSLAREQGMAVSLGSRRSGVSLGYAARLTRPPNASLKRAADTLGERVVDPMTRGFALSAWHNTGRAVFTLSVGSRSQRSERPVQVVRQLSGVDTVASDSGPIYIPRTGTVYETQWRPGAIRGVDTELRMLWSSGRLALDLLAGGALGSRAAAGRLWGRSEASVAVTPWIAVVGAMVVDNAVEWRHPVPRRYGTLGIRLTSSPFSKTDATGTERAGAAGFRLRDAGGGRTTVGIRAPLARTVEITGDFTKWRPVRMQRAGYDWWEITLALPPGAHRVNVRVDGGRWTAPPGLPRERDDFGGEAGVLVVP